LGPHQKQDRWEKPVRRDGVEKVNKKILRKEPITEKKEPITVKEKGQKKPFIQDPPRRRKRGSN